ncbi:uncharacterized protein LOC143025587 isoform X2 [Oratosquilla oratoria]
MDNHGEASAGPSGDAELLEGENKKMTNGTEEGSPPPSPADSDEVDWNPSPPSVCEEENATLKVDAIGDTVYSERWVLKILMKLIEALPQYLSTDNTGIMELDEDVEAAACQLWDMTVERDVVLHLLHLPATDILHLLMEIMQHSHAPRLTEIAVGIIANMCSQKEACCKIASDNNLVVAIFGVLETEDVPTLIETFRLLKLLLWHLTHNVEEKDIKDSLIIQMFKGDENIKTIFIFLLKNSLNESLLTSMCNFIESLLYFWLPDEQRYLSYYFAYSGFVEAMVVVMRCFTKAIEKYECEDVVHKCVLILYSFISGAGTNIIVEFDEKEPLLEPLMVKYVEQIAKVETLQDMTPDDLDHLTYALGLCELLVLHMRDFSLILSVVKMLDLMYGKLEEYMVISKSRLIQDEEMCDKENSSAEDLERIENSYKNAEGGLVDYCLRLVRFSPKIDNVLGTLDQCHVHEVQQFFTAIKERDTTLVGELQEKVLDTKKHVRLVTILSEMYA